MIFQEPMTSLNPVLSVGYQIQENILLHNNVTPEEAKKRTIDAMKMVNIPDAETRYDYYPQQFSGGMRQRAALLRTYLFSADVALLDEPFSALDTFTKSEMHRWYLDVMSRIRLSTIFITHDVDEAILLSDRIYLLGGRPGYINGEIVIAQPKPRRKDFNLSEAFLNYKREIVSRIIEVPRKE